MTMTGCNAALTRAIGVVALFALPSLGTPVSASGEVRLSGYPYTSGKDLYEHICQGCHMADARGATGAGTYPALADDNKLTAAAYVALVVLRGQKAMPSFPDLTDAQIVEVTNYVRSHFGNRFPDGITAAQVRALRPKATHHAIGRAG